MDSALEQAEAGNYRKAVLLLNEAAEQGSSGAQLQAASLYKYHCSDIMEVMDAGNTNANLVGNHNAQTASTEVIDGLLPSYVSGVYADFEENVLETAQEVGIRWADAVVNLVNGLLQYRAIEYDGAATALQLNPFCSSRAIDFLERAAEQDQLASGVELGDLLYDAGTGGGIGGHYTVDENHRDNPDSAASLQLAAYYYRKAMSTERSARAMFNIAFMHQFGIGLRKDFHLAERYYDMAVATDFRAFAPCKLALFGLQLHRVIDGEALPDYLKVVDVDTILVFLVGIAVFVLGSYVLLVL